MGMVLKPVTDLELVDHGGHAHLVLLGEAVQVAQHAFVHGRRRRRRRPMKKPRVLEPREEPREERRTRDSVSLCCFKKENLTA